MFQILTLASFEGRVMPEIFSLQLVFSLGLVTTLKVHSRSQTLELCTRTNISRKTFGFIAIPVWRDFGNGMTMVVVTENVTRKADTWTLLLGSLILLLVLEPCVESLLLASRSELFTLVVVVVVLWNLELRNGQDNANIFETTHIKRLKRSKTAALVVFVHILSVASSITLPASCQRSLKLYVQQTTSTVYVHSAFSGQFYAHFAEVVTFTHLHCKNSSRSLFTLYVLYVAHCWSWFVRSCGLTFLKLNKRRLISSVTSRSVKCVVMLRWVKFLSVFKFPPFHCC